MKTIQLTQNKVALVDDEDFAELNKYKWCAVKHRNTYYACRGIKIRKKMSHLLMHKEILQPPKGLLTDHINHNGLDNRKINLRSVTNAQNQWNTCCKYNGATWHKRDKKWVSRIRHNGRRLLLGSFNSKTLAQNAYQEARLNLRGVFSC